MNDLVLKQMAAHCEFYTVCAGEGNCLEYKECLANVLNSNKLVIETMEKDGIDILVSKLKGEG